MLKKHFENSYIVILYDLRNMSKEFAKSINLTFAANDIKVYLF
ncbi:hypothetical protein ACV3QY_06950 [Clostridium perfringens]